MPSTNSNHLPQQFTSFVGREQELADISQRLADPACRLLTLVGPGGIGKTRLAMQATAAAVSLFPDGACFVNLQPVHTEGFFVTAVADALNITLTGQEPPLELIRSHLTGSQILLTLDNFEQLIDTSPILSEMLLGTDVKILVTSREMLNLQEEWLYPLSGLSFPVSTQPNDKLSVAELSAYSAVQLFTDRAKRIRPSFSFEQEKDDVVQICQMVEGMPLALELAAPWVKSLSAAEIVTEINHSFDFLTTRLRNLPERHRSLQAIFNQTWDDLSPQEQSVFEQLAVFRDGFLREAATAVAQANLLLLSNLLDKSLLRWETGDSGNGRYQIHELLRQYAEEKLHSHPEKTAEALANHARYFAQFLDQRLDDLLGGRQMEAMAEIEAELNNIRAAWQWAIAHQDATLLLQMGMPLYSFYWFQSRFREARDAYAPAIPAIESLPPSDERDLVLAAMLTNLSWFDIVVEVGHDGVAYAERSFEIYQQLDKPPVFGLDTDPRLIFGIVYRFDERGPEALDFLKGALIEAETRPHLMNQQCAHRLLSNAYHAIGELDTAEYHAQRACDLSEQQGDLWGSAYNRDALGRVALAKKDYTKATQELLSGYELHKQLHFRQGLADISIQLTDLELRQGNGEQAKKYALEGLALYEETKTLNHTITLIVRMAHAAVIARDLESARSTILYALARGVSHYHLFPDIICYLSAVAADICLHRDEAVLATRWLTYTLAQPALQSIQREYAQDLYEQAHNKLDSSQQETAVYEAEALTLEAIIAEIKTSFLTPFKDDEEILPDPEQETAVAANQALIDPLTNRELEVLALIADGLSNRQIAEELVISTGTVKYYTSHIYSKLQVTSRTQAVATARELGILA